MKKVLSIWLAFFFLAADTGITLGMHFCGGKVVKTAVAIGEKKLDCGMARPADACKSPSSGIGRENCCSNKYVQVKSGLSRLANALLVRPADSHPLSARIPSPVFLPESPSEAGHAPTAYSPPETHRDIPVLVRSFLI